MTRIAAGARRLGAWLGGQFIDDVRRGFWAGMEALIGPPA
jgi:hypothetical protein